MVNPPTVTDQPTAPEWWECQGAEVAPDLMGSRRFADPADLDGITLDVIAGEAADEVSRWHRYAADGMRVPAWKTISVPESFSGHKLHVGCATGEDVSAVLRLVLPVVIRAGLGCKASTAPESLRGGKGVVVYLPRRATADRDASLIVRAVAGYAPARPVDIRGGVCLAGAVWWRWEFSQDPGADVWSLSEYRGLYVPA